MSREILQQLIENFNIATLERFFQEKSRSFKPLSEPIKIDRENFTSGLLIGKIRFPDSDFIACAFKVLKPLSERSSKKAQYDVAKAILKQEQADAGIFVFYDNKADFRFSLVYTNYLGIKREFSNFRRFTYFVTKDQTNKTFLTQIGLADFSSIEKIKEAFSVEKVTQEFFEAYKYAIEEVIIEALDRKDLDYKLRHAFAQQLLSRILFLYFVQRKGWLKWKNDSQDKNYLRNLWDKYKHYKRITQKNTFYSTWLNSLFFGAFNKKSSLISNELPSEINESFRLMPYLNGGLFTENDFDRLDFMIPDSVFEWLFEPDERANDKKKGFLELFNFTTDESLPLDTEVAVDPEMLGNVYESLISSEERDDSGIFYTPRIEIDLMSRLSLIEYLTHSTNLSREALIDMVLNPSTIEKINDIEKLKKIKTALDKVKIVDPACGSASFLVGMLNVLIELQKVLSLKIYGKDENLFTLKEKIILENLYGVEVKDWAVMVGELRLWLSLIIETEEKDMNIYTEPLLPNLSFKIRQGNSLVEEIGGVFISLRGDALKSISRSIQQKISELIDRKAEFFSGKSSAGIREKEEIENLEIEIFREILQSKIDESEKALEKRKMILSTKQIDAYGRDSSSEELRRGKIKEELNRLEDELSNFKKALSSVGKNGKKDYFLWELDFAEVFALNGGFDIVIGNPPYVRQENIAPPLAVKDNFKKDEWREIKKEYKNKLIKAVQAVWKDIKKINKKSDLYVFFYYQGLSLLNENGIFCFINSNSWLDVGYGAGLQEFLLKNMKPIYIIDNIAKRSFKQADVNTVIVLIQKPETKPADFTVKFVAFKKPFEEALNAEVLKEIEKADKPIFDNPFFRVYPKTKKELIEEGVEYPDDMELDLQQNAEQLPYIGNKWGGKYLRAPEIYFKILEKGKGKLVRLGDIAEVRFGIKTGANEFFYLKPVGMTVKEVVEISEKNPNALIRVKNGADWEGEIEAEFLKPVIKSPRELKTIMVRIEDLNYLVFMCHKSKKELKETKALEYIEWGERQKYNLRPTCRSRNLWWDLGEPILSTGIWTMTYRERFFVSFNNLVLVDARLYNIYCQEWILHILNSTYCLLLIEIQARGYGGGGGPVDVKVYEVNNLIIPILNSVLKNKGVHAFNKLKKRVVEQIFAELGFDRNRPIREQEPNPLLDRKELDDIVFDALGLTAEERKEVYWAVAELVKARLDKAKSV